MIADLAVVLILALFLYSGCKKGIVKPLMGLVSYLASLILTFVLYKPVSGMLNALPLKEKLNSSMEEKIAEFLMDKTKETVPSFLEGFVQKGVLSTASDLADAFTDLCVFVVCLIVVFIAVKLLLKLTDIFAKIIKKLPLIGSADKLLGGAVGLINGFIVVFTVLIVLMLFAGADINEMINSSYIAKYLRDNNILLNMIIKYL